MFKTIYKDKILKRNENFVRKLPEIKNKVNLDFSSNDYLGLSHNAMILEAAINAAKKYGVGATGSRLLSGNSVLFSDFESSIARAKNMEAALIFNSGFQCNAFVLASLLDEQTLGAKPLVFFDRLNHSSLYQAVFLSGAKLVRYRHNDYKHLQDLISGYHGDERPKFIVTETVFGMDGDIAPLDQIADIAQQYNAMLYLDEAHATGVIGENGYGLSTTMNNKPSSMVVMGTFSKALGGSGAYVACDREIADYLINFCPGFIYSTANSPFVIGAAAKAWRMLPGLAEKRQLLHNNSNYLREELRQIGLNIGNSVTNIIPIIIGDEVLSKDIASKLMENGIKVSCIVPPTVPPGTARIRIALTVNHTKKEIDQLIESLKCLIPKR